MAFGSLGPDDKRHRSRLLRCREPLTIREGQGTLPRHPPGVAPEKPGYRNCASFPDQKVMAMKESTEVQLFRQAIQVLKKGDRATARQLMRQVLLENPRYSPAWLWMSELVDSIEQKRECLERTLALDPANEPARKGLELLRLQEVSEAMPEPSPSDPQLSADTEQHQARRLGEYLIERQIITASQLEKALNEQRLVHSSLQGARVPLGDMLIKLGMLTPQMLATILVEQQQHRMGAVEGQSPEYLGEYLVTKGIITKRQLEMVLAEQIRQRQIGRKMLLGELLIRAGYITPGALDSVLEQQRSDVFRRFGFGEDQDYEDEDEDET
jgi:hypothetical protein